MMSSNLDDDFPANPFRSDGGPGSFAQSHFQPATQQQFQQGHPGGSGISGVMSPQTMDPTMPTSTPTSWWGFCTACMRLETYQKYFDVDTDDIKNRMVAAMTHFHQPQYFRDQVIGPESPHLSMQSTANTDLKGPDLYGPVWITFVLILLLAATANWSASLHYNVEEFEYDIEHLLNAWTFLTAFVFGVPTVFWLCTRCMSLQALTLAEWICYYGYSMVPYLPASLVCIIPVTPFAWLALLAATGASGLLVLRNASTPLLASDPTHQKAPPLILAILVTHFIFYVLLTITFYQHGK